MTAQPKELDARIIPPPSRHQEIFRTFDALAPGDAFILVNDHDPKPLLYQFQAERPGRFEWSVLEAGPERFRIEIRRRTAEGPRTVTDYLEADHRRLDAIAADVDRLSGEGALAEAGGRFAEFACGLDRHIVAEEQILFPAFERMTGMTMGGPTAVMRSEHVEIRGLMARIAGAIHVGDGAGAQGALQQLGQVLGMHNVKEEQILYPMTDQAAGGERERDDLVKRLQAL
ncbi:MAG: DUF2249 domain-containing protein [Deltaproteobacteria bacterium]|nr:DUF2249 domain-containing protein [Deltaproteobacteria bacterium]